MYSIEGNEKITNDCRYPIFVTQARQSKKETKTGGSAKLPQRDIEAKIMLNIKIT